MKICIAVALIGSAAAAGPTRADFLFVPPDAAAGGAVQPAPEAVQDPPAAARRPVPTGALPAAQGFGQQVPLAFAVRQIVPARIKVTFGPGVDRDAAVDWTGGRPWDEALRAAVRPLGLRVAVGWGTVSIVRR